MTAEEKNKLETEIQSLKDEQANCKGPKCEVYSRVVGYMRPVQNWNKGKKAEYEMRKTYKVENAARPNGCEAPKPAGEKDCE